MKKYAVAVMVLVMCGSIALIGCGAKKEVSSQKAVEQSKILQTVEQKINYLSGQTKAFINSKEYDQAVTTANYILRNLDANSVEAKNLLEKAKTAIAAKAKSAASDAKKRLGNFGK